MTLKQPEISDIVPTAASASQRGPWDRELEVLSGVGRGAGQRWAELQNQPSQLIGEVVISGAASAALTALYKAPGFFGLAGRALTLTAGGMGAFFTVENGLVPTYNALTDAWKPTADLSADKEVVARKLGGGAIDFGLMGIGSSLGFASGRSVSRELNNIDQLIKPVSRTELVIPQKSSALSGNPQLEPLLGGKASTLTASRTDQPGVETRVSIDKPDTEADQIEAILQTGRLRLSKARRDLETPAHDVIQNGSVESPSGKLIPVVIHRADAVREYRSIDESEKYTMDRIAYDLHRVSDFTSIVPAVVRRTASGGSIGSELYVQQRIGSSIPNRLRMLAQRTNTSYFGTFRSLMTSDNTEFPDQLEQATVERLIFGDWDGHQGNFTLTAKNKTLRVGSIDFENAFGTQKVPDAPDVLAYEDGSRASDLISLRGKLLSSSTINKISKLVNKLDTESGRAYMNDIGLNGKQSDALVARAKWFLEHRRFQDPY